MWMAHEKQHDNLSSGLYKKACTCTLPNTHTHTTQPYRKIKYVLLQNSIPFLKIQETYNPHSLQCSSLSDKASRKSVFICMPLWNMKYLSKDIQKPCCRGYTGHWKHLSNYYLMRQSILKNVIQGMGPGIKASISWPLSAHGFEGGLAAVLHSHKSMNISISVFFFHIPRPSLWG